MLAIARMTEVELTEHDDQIDQTARVLKVMGHPLRLKILCMLGDQEMRVQDIVEGVGTTQSNVSQHLGALFEQRLLDSRRESNRVYYRIGDSRTLSLIGAMQELFCRPSG